MKLSYLILVMLAAISTVSCGKKDEIAKSPVQAVASSKDEEAPTGTWVEQYPDGKAGEIIITTDKFDVCQWLNKKPDEGYKFKGCISYFTGEKTNQKEIKSIIDEFLDLEKVSINNKEKQRKSNDISTIKIDFENLEKSRKEYYDLIKFMGEDVFFNIFSEESDAELQSGDCNDDEFIGQKYYYILRDCRASNMGYIIRLYKKK
jgi:hypothetical protein